MDFNLNSNQIQYKQDRYIAQADSHRLVADLPSTESRVMPARRRIAAVVGRIGWTRHVATPPLPDPDAITDPASAVQTGR